MDTAAASPEVLAYPLVARGLTPDSTVVEVRGWRICDGFFGLVAGPCIVETREQTLETLDLSAVPVLRRETHLPVVLDPSHAAGRSELVLPLARAAVAAGADGVIVEVHPRPEDALCDGPQLIRVGEFARFADEIRTLVALMGKTVG